MFLVILRLGLDFIVMYLYVFVYYSLILMERIFVLVIFLLDYMGFIIIDFILNIIW